MSKTIDSRVVEMRFDNKQFEAGAKQTILSLSKLKEALKLPNADKALKGIDEVSKNISLDGLVSGVDALNYRFSFLGERVRSIANNVYSSLMNGIKKPMDFVTDSIVSGGIKRAMNIENAHFQLQALLKDEGKVQAVMADAMESVDGTAYAYDEAAKAASQFAASGIQSGEEMLGALKGITGVAAMTNSSFEDISNVFTTVAGNGRLMGDQLLQLSSRGLNAASTLADYFKEVRGQANMTEGTIREMVSAGKISFKDFSDAMTWAFGDSAKRANETFNGAFSNMKSAFARIGEGFISPFIEQNGEMVNLFNALRIKINDIKSSLVFDEERSAIAGLTNESKLLDETYGKMLRNGTISMDTFIESMFKANNAEDVYGKKTEKVQEILTNFNETGKLTSDMLSDLNKFGTRSSDALRQYVNGVQNGTIQASDAMKEKIAELGNGMTVLNSDIKKWTEEGKIDYELFTDAMGVYTRSTLENAGSVETVLKGMFSEVKNEGHLTTDALKEFSDNGMDATEAILRYMTGVKDGSIRASYATKSAIEEMSSDLNINHKNLDTWLEEGAISYDIFQSAMENAYGTEKTLSKTVTDSLLDGLKSLVTWINELDVTDAMSVFYFGVESVSNVLKGLLSILKPIGKAFAEVFLGSNSDSVITFAEAIEAFTSKLRLSEKGSENLHDAFKGLFDIGKLLADIIFEIAGALLSVTRPAGAAGEGFLGIIGLLGRGLSSLIQWIRQLTLLKKAFRLMTGSFSLAMTGLSKLIGVGKSFVGQISKLEGTTKLINSINKAFSKLGTAVSPHLKEFVDTLELMINDFLFVGDFDFDDVLESISDALSGLANKLDNIDFSNPTKIFDKFKGKIQEFKDFIMSNEGFVSFVEHVKEFSENVAEALTWDNILERIDKIMSVFDKFYKWIKNTLAPAFADFNIGSVLAAGGGFGIIYAFIKAAKAIDQIGSVVKSTVSLMGAAKGVLVAWQKDLKADMLLKIAKAIGILAISITILSFADMERAWQAAIMLGLVGAALVAATGYFINAQKKAKPIENVAASFSKAANKLAKAMKIKVLGGAVKNFAKSIMMVAGSVVALGLMYEHNPESFDAAVKLVGKISALLVVFGVLSAIIGKVMDKEDAKSMQSVGKTILFVTLSLSLVVGSISKLMSMKLPSAEEVDKRIGIFVSILASMAAIMLVAGVSARIAGGNELPKMAKAIKSLAVLLATTVGAIYVLFKINLPTDYEARMDLLYGVLTKFSWLMIAIGVAARLSGGNNIKAAGTILSMAAFLVVLTGSLAVLSLLPTEKMESAAVALGGILITLAVALYGASKISSDKDAAKSILSMAIMVGVITATLAILTLIPFDKLMTSAIALGGVMSVLALNFNELSKVKSGKALPAAISMIAAVGIIAYSLYELSKQPWESLLTSAAAMSITILAFSKSFEMILGKRWSENNVKKVGTFVLLAVSMLPIAYALYKLSEQPWDSMIVSALALSGVAAALVGIYFLMSKVKPDLTSIIAFVAGAVALVPIAAALNMLAGYGWDSILPALTALGGAALILSGAMTLMSLTGPGILSGVIAFVAGAVSLIPIAIVMNTLSGLSWEQVATGLVALAGALAVIGVAGLAGIAIAPGLLLLSVSLIAFGAAIAIVGAGLLVFTTSLVGAVDIISMLFDTVGVKVDEFKQVGLNLIQGFINGLTEGFKFVWDKLKEFADGVVTKVKGFLGIHSPSTVFEELGVFTDEGFANGITKGEGIITDSLSSVFGGLKDKIDLGSLFGTGKEASENIAKGVESGKEGISSSLSTIFDGIKMVNTSPMEDVGKTSTENMISAMAGGINMVSVNSSFSSLADQIDTSSFEQTGGVCGMNFISGLETGFDMNQIQELLGGSDISNMFDTSQFTTIGELGSMDFLGGM